MKLLLNRALLGNDVSVINDSGIDYEIIYLKAQAPQDLGWRDYETGQVIPTPNHRVVFHIRESGEESFLRLRFTSDLLEV